MESQPTVFQSKYMGYAVWIGEKPKEKKLKFHRGIYQTSDEKEIEFLSKDKNVVRLHADHEKRQASSAVSEKTAELLSKKK